MKILINLILVIWMIVALLMILVILMQRPKSEGLGAAFGGGVTENIFGAQTTTVLTKITGWLAGIFFVLTFVLSVLYAYRATGESALSRELKKSAVLPQTSATPIMAVSPSPARGREYCRGRRERRRRRHRLGRKMRRLARASGSGCTADSLRRQFRHRQRLRRSRKRNGSASVLACSHGALSPCLEKTPRRSGATTRRVSHRDSALII